MVVTAIMVVEILGRPADHTREAIEKFMENLDKVKGVEVIKKEFSEPKLVDDKNQMYTCFCEAEFNCLNLSQLIDITFDFMPSSIEVVEPAKLEMSLNDATSLLNGISGRLHRYDEVVKIVQNRERKMMEEIAIAKRVLKDNNLIDKDGKIILKKNEDDKEKSEKED